MIDVPLMVIHCFLERHCAHIGLNCTVRGSRLSSQCAYLRRSHSGLEAGPKGRIPLLLIPLRLRLSQRLLCSRPGRSGGPPSLFQLRLPQWSGLKLGSLLVYPEVDRPAPADPQGPYSALTVGPLRLEPRFGNVFTVADALQVVCVLYGGQTDPSTGKAALHARFSFLKDGKPVARGQDQAFDTPMAVASVGPVPLSGFAAGRYVVRVDAQDQVAGQAQTQEVTFEIKE